ncbi:MAG: glycosyltransferase [Candidatus Helarchaeota archaeon]|nr:glycosyltransferase [Candidatus Helarchaeota archaeon]
MKIGFFTDTYSQVNGVTVTIKAVEQNLRDLGHEVYIFAPRGEAENLKNNPYLFTSQAIRFIFSPEYQWAIFPVFTIPQSNLGLDIIHVHSPISMGLAGLMNARRLAIPCIGSIHTLLPEFWKPFLEKYISLVTPPLLKRAIKQFLSLFDHFSIVNTTLDLRLSLVEQLSWRYMVEFFKRCDLSLVPSTYAQNECLNHGLTTQILPNGIDFAKFQLPRDPSVFNKRWNLDPQDRLLIYAGRLSEEKNIDLILNSAPTILKTTDHLKYMIIGDGPHRNALEKLVEKNQISENVIFTGYLNSSGLSECYSRAMLYINPSPFETQGLSVIEAMYFGCPILSVNSGGVAELIDNSTSGLLCENTPEALTRTLLAVLEDQSILKKYRVNAKVTASEYDIKKFCKQLIAIYEQLLTKKTSQLKW